MNRLGREDVLQLPGQAEQLTVAEILATGATRDKLTEAPAWIVNDEALINGSGSRLGAPPPDRDQRGRRRGTVGHEAAGR